MAMHSTFVCDICQCKVSTREGIFPKKWWRVRVPCEPMGDVEVDVCSIDCAIKIIEKFGKLTVCDQHGAMAPATTATMKAAS